MAGINPTPAAHPLEAGPEWAYCVQFRAFSKVNMDALYINVRNPHISPEGGIIDTLDVLSKEGSKYGPTPAGRSGLARLGQMLSAPADQGWPLLSFEAYEGAGRYRSVRTHPFGGCSPQSKTSACPSGTRSFRQEGWRITHRSYASISTDGLASQ